MKKKVIKILFLLIVLFFPCFVLAYTDGDEAVTTTKIYNFLTEDINNEDLIRLYNPNNTETPSYFNLNEYYYQRYNFHIPVANQKNLGLCDTFSSLKHFTFIAAFDCPLFPLSLKYTVISLLFTLF